MSNEGTPPKKRGCLFYGCLSSIILGLLVVALFVAFYFAAKRFVNNMVATEPDFIESVTYTPEEREALQRRLTAFTDAVAAGKGGQELVLSAGDLNALIAEKPDLKGKLFVMIEDDKLRGKVSIPLKDIWPFKLDGRYLNGRATFKASLTNGVLDVRLEEIQVKSNALPARIVSRLKQQNLAKEYQNDPKQQEEIQKYESLRFQDGKVFIRSKEATPETPKGQVPP